MTGHTLRESFILALLATVTGLLSAAAPAAEGDRDMGGGLERNFADPPTGYGMVPLYWWTGEPLSLERIAWELDQLKAMGFTGVQANFVPFLDGSFQERSSPPPFSEGWWKVWEDVVRQCKARGMTLGIDDYGFHDMIWDLKNNPDLQGWHLERVTGEADGGRTVSLQAPAGTKVLSARAYRLEGGRAAGESVDLSDHVNGPALSWKAPDGSWRAVLVVARPGGVDMSNPKSGQVWIDNWFKRFEDHSPGEMGKTLSYFFQDEFYFPGMPFWSDRMPGEFLKRKGYDLVPELPAVFEDVGPRTPKVRLDYYDVSVSLLEEGYFRPVYEWCQARGAIYGHDNLRGSLVDAVRSYGDYFRTQRWFQAPGSDRMPDLIIGKTCASIAQLYGRPRAWLEAYYGTGWGVSPENLFVWNNQSLMDGYNLLSYHSLYYSTRAGWWTWAPGDPHFRQPYWSLMDGHYAYTRRLCYLLSQGVHRCDAAIVLPIAAIQAGRNGALAQQSAHGVAQLLFAHGVDFDFIDDPSVERAEVEGGQLAVSGGAYRVLVLPSPSVVRHATFEKALAFHRAGGAVVAIGALPEASDRVGSGDVELEAGVAEIFGETPPKLKEELERALREATGFSSKTSWIWTPESPGSLSVESRYFRKSFVLSGEAAKGRLRISCDNIHTSFVNGQRVGSDETWETVEEYDVTGALRAGPNAIAIQGRTTDPGWAGLAAELVVILKDGSEIVMATDETWRSLGEPPPDWREALADESRWLGTRRLAAIGEGPWGDSMRLAGAREAEPSSGPPIVRRGPTGGVGAVFVRPDDPRIVSLIDESIPRDFVSAPAVHVLHRRIGAREVYALMNPGGTALRTEARFRAKGRPALWDPWTGRMEPAILYRADAEFTRLPLRLDPYELKLVVFDPGAATGPTIVATDLEEVAAIEAPVEPPSRIEVRVTGYCREGGKKTATVLAGGQTIRLEGQGAEPPPPAVLDGPWDFELVPTLDNRYADFRSPPSPGLLGAEARRFRYAEESQVSVPAWEAPDLDDSRWPEVTWSFGPRFWALGPISQGTETRAIEEKLLKDGRIDPDASVPLAGQDLAWKPLSASLRWGIERDPLFAGAYGTAASALGLKGSVPDAMIDLTSGQPGAIWYVWTSLRAPAPKETRFAIGSPAVYQAWVNGAKVLEQAEPAPNPLTYHMSARTVGVKLERGANPLLLRFVEPQASRQIQLRAYIAADADARDESLAEIDDTKAPSGLLARRGYGRSRDADLDPSPWRDGSVGLYRFRTPPGLKAMKITAQGSVGVWVDGRRLAVSELPDAPGVACEREGARVWRAVAKEPFLRAGIAAIRIEQRPGFYAGSALPEPVEFECGAGQAELGSWADIGLATYSGQARYRRAVTLSAPQALGKVILDLGRVAVAARVKVNGREAGTRISPPWRVDISGLVRAGENQLEILVANTLGSHCWVGVPDGHVFEGQAAAGLLGPARIETWPTVKLEAPGR